MSDDLNDLRRKRAQKQQVLDGVDKMMDGAGWVTVTTSPIGLALQILHSDQPTIALSLDWDEVVALIKERGSEIENMLRKTMTEAMESRPINELSCEFCDCKLVIEGMTPAQIEALGWKSVQVETLGVTSREDTCPSCMRFQDCPNCAAKEPS